MMSSKIVLSLVRPVKSIGIPHQQHRYMCDLAQQALVKGAYRLRWALYGEDVLVIIDAHSKWMEVHKTTSSSAATTISLLRTTFATLGLPEVIVSDNAANFTSEEFSDFLKCNGVRHVRTPPYHPASNVSRSGQFGHSRRV